MWVAARILQSDLCGCFVERHTFLAIFAAIIMFFVFVCGYGMVSGGIKEYAARPPDSKSKPERKRTAPSNRNYGSANLSQVGREFRQIGKLFK